MRTHLTFSDKVRANALFRSVDFPPLPSLAGPVEEKLPDGKIIFENGSKSESFFLILSGTVKISKIMNNGEEITMGLLHAGDIFGEIDLIQRRRRSARATAIGDCKLARIGRKEFAFLVKSNPQFVMNLIQALAMRMRTNNLTYVSHRESNLTALRRQLMRTHRLVEASKIVNSSLKVDKLLDLIFQTAAKTVGADRGTLYLLDESRRELWSKVQKGRSKIEIRLPVGTGIAGSVAATGETINTGDVYKDKRFNPKIDRSTGYRTKSTLCMPMKNRQGKITGVFQLLNKYDGKFTKEDEEFIEAFSVHASLALENARMVQKIVQNERLSAVGSMASTIIHDIKNPMGVLRLSAQIIQSKTENEEIIKFAEEMIRQIDRFISMTQEVLDFARGITILNIRKVNFKTYMDTIALFLKKEMSRRNVKLERKFKFSGNVMLDPEKIMRVVYNLAANAADAMPKGGKLTICTSRSGRNLMIEVSDTGHGMDDEIKRKVFDPFFTSGKRHGTGLGMAIVKKIMDDHKGNIEIKSIVGKGTTIKLRLPL